MKPWSKPRQSREDAERFMLQAQQKLAELEPRERGGSRYPIELRGLPVARCDHALTPYLCSVKDCPARRWQLEAEMAGAD